MPNESRIEDLLEDVRDFIFAHVDTYTAAINTAKADGLTIESFRKIEVADDDPYTATMYPLINLMPIDLTIEPLATGIDSMSVQIGAVIAINSGSPTTKLSKLLRYCEGLRSALRDYLDLGVTTFDLDSDQKRIEFTYRPGESVKTALMTFRARVDIPS